MRKVFVALTAAFALVAFLSACGMGLEPAKTDTTSVSLSLTVMSPLGSGGSTDAGRAIFPDGGYLYVRMIGGPTADTPSFLGPYRVTASSSTVSITEIPAGQYEGMFLLYADSIVHNEEVTIEGDATTLGQIFSLPDTDFLAFVEGDDEYEVEIPTEPVDEELFYEPHPVDVLLAGRASIGMVESPRVVEGKANSFPVTMIPVTPYRIEIYPAELGQTLYLNELLEGTDSFRGFIEIDGVDSLSSYYPAFSGSVKLTFANESTTEAMVVNHLYVYDGDGRLLAKPPVTLPVQRTNDMPYSVTVHTSFNEIFFYLDVSGGDPAITITLDEGGTVETITGSLNLANYISNFDSVKGVMFCTEDPTELFSDTLEEGNLQYLVGWGVLTANDAARGFYDFNGAINSDSAGSALFLIVVGTKNEQPVMYASTRKYEVSQMSDLTPAMTPLM